MALEIIGKLTKILNPQTGTGKNGTWQKQDFILETFDQYPKKICVSAWGDKVEDLKKFGMGDTIKASVNIESREFNEKWYTDVRAWRLENETGSGNQGKPTSQTTSSSSNNEDFGFEPYTPASKVSEPSTEDDLPF